MSGIVASVGGIWAVLLRDEALAAMREGAASASPWGDADPRAAVAGLAVPDAPVGAAVAAVDGALPADGRPYVP